jgi:hypothetical protein
MVNRHGHLLPCTDRHRQCQGMFITYRAILFRQDIDVQGAFPEVYTLLD